MSAAHLTRLVVLAKAPRPGRSKTRLTPPYTPDQAAAIAQACLRDTLDTVCSLATADQGFEAVLCLAGDPGNWLPAGIPVIPQCAGGHDARIACAMEQAVQLPGHRAADAVILIGMDTPQVTTRLLQRAAQIVQSADVAIGPALDGGWWLLGLQRRHARRASDFLLGVPTSTPSTGELQRRRFVDGGLSIGSLPVLRDIDTAADVKAVLGDLSRTARSSRLSQLVRVLRNEAAA